MFKDGEKCTNAPARYRVCRFFRCYFTRFGYNQRAMGRFRFAVLMLIVCLVQEARAVTLSQAYREALKVRSSVAQSRTAETVAEARQDQTLAAVLPTVFVQSDNTWRDKVAGTSFGEGYQHTARISVAQSLFSGGAAYHGLKAADYAHEAASFERKQSELDLYEEVATAFYQLLILKSDVANLKEQEDLLRKRLDFLRQRARIGRTKSSDVLAARSQLARVSAQLLGARSEFRVADNRFRWLTGLKDLSELRDEWQDKPLSVPQRETAELMQLPLIQAREADLEAAGHLEGVAFGAYLPSAALEGNYYLDRAGIISQSKWDVNLTLRWELYSGGNTLAQRRIRAAEKSLTELRLADDRKRLRTDFEAKSEQVRLRIETVAALEEAERLAKRNYELQQQEFRRGLVSNLDVLQALDDYLTTRRTLARERFNARLDWVRLQLLTGETP